MGKNAKKAKVSEETKTQADQSPRASDSARAAPSEEAAAKKTFADVVMEESTPRSVNVSQPNPQGKAKNKKVTVVTKTVQKDNVGTSATNKFEAIGNAIGSMMGTLSSFSYSDKLLIMKSLNGAVGFRPQPTSTVVTTSGVSAPVAKAQAGGKKATTVQSTKVADKPSSPKSPRQRKRKRQTPPAKNPVNEQPEVVSLRHQLQGIVDQIREVKKSLPEGRKTLDSSHTLVKQKEKLLRDLTVARGTFRAFKTLRLAKARLRAREQTRMREEAKRGLKISQSRSRKEIKAVTGTIQEWKIFNYQPYHGRRSKEPRPIAARPLSSARKALFLSGKLVQYKSFRDKYKPILFPDRLSIELNKWYWLLVKVLRTMAQHRCSAYRKFIFFATTRFDLWSWSYGLKRQKNVAGLLRIIPHSRWVFPVSQKRVLPTKKCESPRSSVGQNDDSSWYTSEAGDY